jgi:hypothetical protein
MTPPTSKDRKVSITFTGVFAKDVFSRIGPDLEDACGASPMHRERQRGDLSCTLDGKAYVCHLGLNVVTGKNMEGLIC